MNSNISLKQLRTDFKYLDDNTFLYLVDEDAPINKVSPTLLSGAMDMKDFILWSIKDIVRYIENYSDEDKERIFLRTDKRAQRILNRYSIELQ